jgi:DNA-binding NarL/FixJ family response regulator
LEYVRHNGTAWVLFLDSTSERVSLEALTAGASAILPTSADLAAIVVTVRMVADGLVVFPRRLFAALSGEPDVAKKRLSETHDDRPRLSKCELAVLTAMAGGLSNKRNRPSSRNFLSHREISCRLHSKKIEADTRTEAVFNAAQQGLVML